MNTIAEKEYRDQAAKKRALKDAERGLEAVAEARRQMSHVARNMVEAFDGELSEQTSNAYASYTATLAALLDVEDCLDGIRSSSLPGGR